MWGKTYIKQFVIATSMTVALGGCAELHNRGGLADRAADRLFLADTRTMRVLRGYVILAGLSALATDADLDESERKVVRIQLADALQRLEEAAKCAYYAKGHCYYLDNRMLDFSKSAFKLAVAVLPVEEARNLVNRAQGGNPLAVADLIAISRDAFRQGLRFGAIYRDGWDMYMSVAIYSMRFPSPTTKSAIPAQSRLEYLKQLEKAYSNGHGPLTAWKLALRSQTEGINRWLVPGQEHFLSTTKEIWYNCIKLGAKPSEWPDYKDSKVQGDGLVTVCDDSDDRKEVNLNNSLLTKSLLRDSMCRRRFSRGLCHGDAT